MPSPPSGEGEGGLERCRGKGEAGGDVAARVEEAAGTYARLSVDVNSVRVLLLFRSFFESSAVSATTAVLSLSHDRVAVG